MSKDKKQYSIYIPRITPHDKIEFELGYETDSIVDVHEAARQVSSRLKIDKKCIWIKDNRNPKDDIGNE